MTNSKKILLIDTTLHRKDATGITLSNLFGSWPKENLFMIGSQEMIQLSKMEGYNNTFVLDDKDYYHRFPLGFMLNLWKLFRNIRTSTKSKGTSEIKSTALNSAALTNKFSLRSLFFVIFQRLGLDHLFFRQIISSELREWIKRSDPDYFYAVLSTRHSILFAEKVKIEFNKPLIIHIMDDWPSTIGNRCIFFKYWNRKINIEFKNLVKLSYKRIAISKMMAEEFTIRFGGDWEYFHNPVDLNFWACRREFYYNSEPIFRILYSGRLSIGITNTLQLIAEIIDDIELTENISIKMRIQSNSKPDWIFKFKNTFYSEYVCYEELPKLFSSFDLLLIPYDFQGVSFDFIRLSMPTKATEFMASGTPILIVAPENTAIVQYAREVQWALIVSTLDKKTLKKELLKIISNSELRMKYADQALNVVSKHHEIGYIQDRFCKMF